MKPRILRNAIITPDGTEIVSRHTHDYVKHEDANGHYYIVDGGNSYLKRGWSTDAPEAKENSYCTDHSHATLRQHVEWGKAANGKNQYIKIKDLEEGHIKAILEGGHARGPMEDLLANEIIWRSSN